MYPIDHLNNSLKQSTKLKMAPTQLYQILNALNILSPEYRKPILVSIVTNLNKVGLVESLDRQI